MATQYDYKSTIENKYLHKVKTIKAKSKHELSMKVNAQLAQWKEQEAKARKKEAASNLKERAEALSKKDEAVLTSISTILVRACDIDIQKKWNDLYSHETWPPFVYKPSFAQPAPPTGHPEDEPIFKHVPLYFLRPWAEEKAQREWERKHLIWEEINAQEEQEYQQKKAAYESKVAAEKKLLLEKDKKERVEFEQEQIKHNNELDKVRSASIQSPKLLEVYFSKLMQILNESKIFPCNTSVQVICSEQKKLIEFSMSLIASNDFSYPAGHKYVATTKTIKEVPLKQAEFNKLYDNYVFQTVLSVIAIASKECSLERGVESVVVNAYVHGVDAKNGQEFNSCILSVMASVEQIKEINFLRVDAKECIRSLKGLFAGKLASLTPVNPVVKLDTDDSRFVESRDVLETLDPTQNLAIMEWQDFEHLVRELFEKIFGASGGEVKITQASRDLGVDAVAFDPDPIRGGKFVLQAKRYNNVVGVSAVRDLYGTMMNENASRGLLVTTGYFGSESHDFAKDKPIQLIDGQNLLALLKQHGYGDYNITLNSAASKDESSR